jgi:hypothetical protein
MSEAQNKVSKGKASNTLSARADMAFGTGIMPIFRTGYPNTRMFIRSSCIGLPLNLGDSLHRTNIIDFRYFSVGQMRTTELKINNEKKEAILVAGGSGFKVYTVSGLDGWALALGRKINFIEDKTPEAKTVANYVNLKYQPLNSQESIKQEFTQLIETLNQVEKARDIEPTP